MLYKYILLGSFITLSIYHLLVFIGRYNDFSNLSYSFFCLSMGCILYFTGILPDVSSNEIVLNYGLVFSCHFSSGTIAFFSYIIFKLKKTIIGKFIIIYYIIMTIYLSILTVLFFIIRNKFFINIYFPVLGCYGSLFIILSFFHFLKKRNDLERKEKIIIFGFTILLAFLIFTAILLTINISLPFSVFYFVIFLNALFFAYSLTDSFNREHKDLIILKNSLEQKVLERTKQLEKANEKIKQEKDRKTSFFINLAHETKTPLTLISNYLERYIRKAAQDEDLSIIKGNVDKLQKDMINFLDAEKLERAQIFYNHDQVVDLYRFLVDKIKVFKETARNNNINIQFTLNKDIYIKIDLYALDRIINNLLDNAVKYNRLNGKIEIILKNENNNANIIIKDTGIGISKEHIKNIFNPYYQLSHEKRNIQGIGMGLNIVKKILNQIKGKINIESELNKGTEVYITIPVQKNIDPDKIVDEFNQIKNVVSKKVKHDLEDIYDENKRFSILFVEDNLDMLSFLKENLKKNYNIFLAKNGNEALKKINSIPRQIDLVISDIMMDEMDGYEFYNKYIEIDNLNKSIPFIFLTAKSKHDEKIKGLKLGAVDYIYKPFDITELIAKIESFIGLNEAKNVYLFVKQDEILQNNLEHWFYKKYKITDKEREVINCIINGDMNKEIAYKIDVSEGTIKNYILEIYKKVDVTNRIGLFRKIIRMR